VVTKKEYNWGGAHELLGKRTDIESEIRMRTILSWVKLSTT